MLVNPARSRMASQQERYWATNGDFVTKNSNFDHVSGVRAWKQILKPIQNEIKSVLGCGANIGRNIGFLRNSSLLPKANLQQLISIRSLMMLWVIERNQRV